MGPMGPMKIPDIDSSLQHNAAMHSVPPATVKMFMPYQIKVTPSKLTSQHLTENQKVGSTKR